MNVEMQSMKDNEVCVLVEVPPNGKTVGSKWLSKKKTDMYGVVHTYKARLVAKGYTQTPKIDYKETFSPVADIRAIRILIAIVAYYDYEIWQMDVITAFLNGYLNEEVYMKQPEGFLNPKYPNRVCKLKRSMYGLKQASRQWNKRFDDEIKKFGFTQNHDEPCVYLKASESNITFLILYVDDILIMGNNIPMLQDVKSYLGRCFAMKDLGEAAYILGIKIYRDRSRRVSCYTDAGYLTDADDLKSQTGYVFVLNGGAVYWKSAKKFIYGLGVVPTIEEPISLKTHAIMIYDGCGDLGTLAENLMTTSSANNSVFRVFFEKQKLTGPNFIDLYRQLRIVLSIKDKLNYVEQLIPPTPVVPADIQQNLETFHAHEMLLELKTLFAQQAEHELLQITRDFHSCKQEEGQASKKLKPGALSLYVGHGQREAVEAIDGFINLFVNNTIQVSRNNMVYFSAIPRDDIFKIDLSNSYTNKSSIYVVRNKRAKLDLDSALLWHCRLGHISKKHIEKFQHDGLLNSTDLRAFEKCISCMFGKMERKPYTHKVEMAKDLLGLIHTDSFWNYALETAARIHNMVPNKKVKKTPYEVWHGQALKLSYLKVWSCKALVKRDTLTKPEKLEPRSIKCIFIGYPKETMGYPFYCPPGNKVLVAQNAEFLKNSLITQEASGSLEDLKIIQEEYMHPSIDTSLYHEEDYQEINEPQRDLGEPANYKAALLDPESEKWLNAMNVEMQSIKDNEVWVLVELHPNGKIVDSKWLFKKKTDMDGVVHTYKARLVAKGYTQTPWIDYEETFSPVADIRAIMILIAIAAYYDYEI
nr:retrovirus-related Pol polyprotein from transposon TNT 1-94 [Tanacetum cinerariifolium]